MLKNNESIVRFQYDETVSTRHVLFDYVDTISPEDFTTKLPHFGRGGSIRNVLVHISNTYEFWIGKRALGRDLPFASFEAVKDMNDVRKIFENVDEMMATFFEIYLDKEDAQIPIEINGKNQLVHFVKLCTHVFTHEFHHKGQILSMSRHLGYIPVDTDIMR